MTYDVITTLTSLIKLKSILIQLKEISEEVNLKLEKMKEVAEEKVIILEKRKNLLRIKYEKLLVKASKRHRRLLKAFPDLKSTRFHSFYQI